MSNRRVSALRRVFEPIFGRRWRGVLLLIPVVVGWPILVFRNVVAFDASDFVEEWIKLSVTTVIFYFVVEVVQERRRAESTRREFGEFFEEHVIAPLTEGLAKIQQLTQELNPGAVRDLSDVLAADGDGGTDVRTEFSLRSAASVHGQ